MFSIRVYSGLAWALGCALVTAPLAYAADFSCNVGGLRVGTVPNLPFTADGVDGKWEILPDGSRKLLPPKGSEKPGPWGNPMLILHVARDSEGRVLVERGLEFHPAKAPESGQTDHWSMVTICDPVAGTMTELSHGTEEKDLKDLATGKRVQTFRDIEGTATVTPWTNRRGGGFTARGYGRIEDLGFEQVDGVPTQRYRLRGSVETETTRMVFGEFLVSEELQAELSSMQVDTVQKIEGGIKLIHVKWGEPDPDVYPFKIPEDYTVVYPENKAPGFAPQPVAKNLESVAKP